MNDKERKSALSERWGFKEKIISMMIMMKMIIMKKYR